MPFLSQEMQSEIERRKENVRRVWEYKRVDHIPIMMRVSANPNNYTVQEHFLDDDKQLEIEKESVRLSLALVPDDYIPSMRPDVGCVVIESTLGAEVVFGDDPNQTCTIKEPIINTPDDIYKLQFPDPYTDGLVPTYIRRMKKFVDATDRQVYVACPDMGGAMNVAFTLIGSVNFYMMSYDHPEALHHLASLITDIFINIAETCIKEVGGIDIVTCSDFPYHWHPEGRKGHCSDDICAQYSPEFFNKFSKPYNNRIFERFGGGMMHNCGPNPCASEYLSHQPEIKAVDLAYDYSKNDLIAFKESFRGKGVIYFTFSDPIRGIDEYNHVMQVLAPDVVAIPEVICGPNDDVKGIYEAYLAISKEYAKRIDWKSS